MKYKIIIFLILIILINSFICFGNSMEPPGLVIIVNDKVKDIEAYIIYDNNKLKGTKKVWNNEIQFWFMYSEGFKASEDIKIYLKWEKDEKYYIIKKLEGYHNTFTINLNSNNLIKGKSLKRSIKLVGIRFLLTILLEGIILYLIGFRKSRTWKIFLILNIFTQLGLNIYINSLNVAISYPILALIFSEFWVFLIESIIFVSLVKEKNKKWRISYVLIANLFSLILGGYLITLLPI
ncbi:MAG: hypothetical protein ACQEQE_08800 [Bacillota bacterium]